MARESTEFLIQELKNTRSPKRRSAAKKLRHRAAKEAGPALFEAFELEVSKFVTWETQYQMAMALGECDYKPAIPRLRELLQHEFYGTLVYGALSYALVLLERQRDDDPEPVLSFLDGKHHHLAVDGALMAVAMKRIVYDEATAARILSRVPEENRYWPTIACAGWSGPAVIRYLMRSEHDSNHWIREAAVKAKAGVYARDTIL